MAAVASLRPEVQLERRGARQRRYEPALFLLGWIYGCPTVKLFGVCQVDVLFDTLDANGDGLITREEMRGALASQAQAKAQTQARAVSPSVGRCATLSLFDLGFD